MEEMEKWIALVSPYTAVFCGVLTVSWLTAKTAKMGYSFVKWLFAKKPLELSCIARAVLEDLREGAKQNLLKMDCCHPRPVTSLHFLVNTDCQTAKLDIRKGSLEVGRALTNREIKYLKKQAKELYEEQELQKIHEACTEMYM